VAENTESTSKTDAAFLEMAIAWMNGAFAWFAAAYPDLLCSTCHPVGFLTGRCAKLKPVIVFQPR